MIRSPTPWLLAGAAALALAGCGKQGDLERPAPLWGAKRAQYEAEQRAAAAKAREAGNATAGQPGPDQPAPPLLPPRSAPMPGSKSDPSASAPPGVLPDPYARPQ